MSQREWVAVAVRRLAMVVVAVWVEPKRRYRKRSLKGHSARMRLEDVR